MCAYLLEARWSGVAERGGGDEGLSRQKGSRQWTVTPELEEPVLCVSWSLLPAVILAVLLFSQAELSSPLGPGEAQGCDCSGVMCVELIHGCFLLGLSVAEASGWAGPGLDGHVSQCLWSVRECTRRRLK